LIGAASPELARRLASAVGRLGLSRAFVVHGAGFDEATPCGPFQVHVVTGTASVERELTPEDFGLARCAPADLAGGDARENAACLVALFENRERGPLRDALCLNAALVLLLLEREATPRAALCTVAAALDDGRAARFLTGLVERGGKP
jgi:anthranilate phosphoribosyltransferase